MKYRDLIQFEPINEVVKFGRLNEGDYRESLVRNFVFSKTYEKTIIPELCKNLDYTSSDDTFGTQIVGNYGTGKSHLMSLVSLVAEDSKFLPLVQNESARQVLGNIAGKYKVVRFELGSDDELWRLIGHQIDLKFQEWGIDYSISADTLPDMYSNKLDRMMAQFEKKYPDKGLMIVIDEMLAYLKGRSGSDKLNRDLSVLQALGQASDHSKFRIIFGVQELIYNAPEFAWASNMLNKVNDRFRAITITKQDVQFVVQQRLLKKTEGQKATIRHHLERFTEFFTDMHANLEDYVNLFPVNPSFFENFQLIKIGKAQREVLKTLSRKFNEIIDDEVPETEPGLICYDSYWEDLHSSEMQTYPDIRRVTEIMNTVHQKIDENFTGVRAKNAPLAHRIADACAVKILQDSLEKTNGVNVENLVDDLCYLPANCMSRELLIDIVNTTASQIVSATVGQYFEKNNQNQEYHLRVEGGVNYEQKIKDFVATMTPDNKDSHFFNFLVEYLPIETEQYKREFKIFQHRINWNSHKTMLEGYIFMGNPNERSTAQPEQNFYIYFMPIFNKAKLKHGNEPDSIYVHMEKVSDEMKELLELYAAAEAIIKTVDSSQKPFYEQYKKRYEDKLKPVFNRDFVEKTEIVYLGEVQSVNLSGSVSKEQVISDVASTLLEDYFNELKPDYPKFTLLRVPLTPDNRKSMIQGALKKIVTPSTSNTNSEAILAGLDLLQDGQLSIEGSQYALSIKHKLDAKGEGQVLNRDEILHRFYKEWENDWRSNDFNIEADLEFLVLSTMVALGEIEIDLPGKNINAANLKEIEALPADAYYNFSHIRHPKGMNLALVRKIFLAVCGRDLTSKLHDPATYTELVTHATKLAADAVKLMHDVGNAMWLEDVPIIGENEAMQLRNRLQALSGFCDKLQNYNSEAKLRNLPSNWTSDSLQTIFATIPEMDRTRKVLGLVEEFRQRLNYLSQTRNYLTDNAQIQQVNAAIDKISGIVKVMDDESKVSAYKAELDALKGSYADWYLAEYKRLHITGMQEMEKNRILQSNEKKICEAVFRADHDRGYFSQGEQYNNWLGKMSELTTGGNITRDQVLSAPSVGGFNPANYKGKNLPELNDLKEEIREIEALVDEALHVTLKDKTLLANKEILEPGDQRLLERFNKGDEALSAENAGRLVDIVAKLHKGIRKINITPSQLRNVFNHPMTPDDAIKAFRALIKETCGGDDSDSVRIIFK